MRGIVIHHLVAKSTSKVLTVIETQHRSSIDSLLGMLVFDSKLIFESGLCGDWRLLHKQPSGPSVHLITEGECWLAFPNQLEQQQKLGKGDVVLFTQTPKHWFASEPVLSNATSAQMDASFCEPTHQNAGLVCYDIEVVSPLTQAVFQSLPEWILLPAAEQQGDLHQLIQIIISESKAQKVGCDVAISRLSDVLILYFLRQILSYQPFSKESEPRRSGHQGILAGICDEKLRPMLVSVIQHIDHAWDVEQMAERCFLSKSAFAERCQQVTGLSPKQLVAEVRLQKSRQLLHQTDLSIDVIAEQVGYQSATAFIRFFKQYHGDSPGNYRKQAALR